MTKRSSNQVGAANGDASFSSRSYSITFDGVLLFILLALIPIRAVISETHTFEVPRSLRTLDAPAGASPATTFFINAIIFSVATIVFARRAWTGRSYLKTGAEWGMVLLVIAMIVSTCRAGQKHLAIIGSLDFFGLLLYCITLRQLIIRPWHVRLALAVILATGGMMIAKCAFQRWFELPETIKYYQEHKGELIVANQSTPGFIYDYEQRLKSGAVTGYFPHPNVLASYLLLIIMASLAVVAARWRTHSKWTAIVPLAIAITGFIALVAAQSKGAVAALSIGLLLWGIAHLARSAIHRRPGAALAAVWSLLILGGVIFVGVLHFKPEALGRSILFRTFYWSAAGRMIHDHPWGVGANNFGRFFTRYKDVECPEDIEDPHSWLVRATAEWGGLGLAGMLVVFGGISRRLARIVAIGGVTHMPSTNTATEPGFRNPALLSRHEASPTASIILSSAALAFLIFGVWYTVLFDANAAHLLLTFHLPLIAWFAIFIIGAYEPADSPRFLDAPLAPMLAPLCAGMLAFLIHTGIDLAMFTSGPATLFFTLIAIACRVRCADQPIASDVNALRKRILALPTACLLLVVVLLTLGAKAGLANQFLQSARREPSSPARDQRGRPRNALWYSNAVSCYHQDSTAQNELIDVLIPNLATLEQSDDLLTEIDTFAARDAHNALVHHYRAILYAQRFELAMRLAGTTQASGLKPQALPDLDRAIDSARLSIDAYPTNPSRHTFLANLLERRAAASASPEDRKQFAHAAAAELQTALGLEAKRIYVSPLHRMTKEYRSTLIKRIGNLRTEA